MMMLMTIAASSISASAWHSRASASRVADQHTGGDVDEFRCATRGYATRKPMPKAIGKHVGLSADRKAVDSSE